MNKKVRVELGDRSYNIHIGQTWLLRLPELLSGLARNSQHILISDQIVFDLYGVQVLDLLRAAGLSVEPAVLTGGEGCKTLDSIGWLCEQMLDWGLDRKSSVIALGGGIVGDIAGFAAASYMRGIGFIQIPTTLLAQVDSSVGGKTGVNLPQGKNLVGAFYQPQLVFIELDFLDTLPEKEYLTGLAEVIKYGIIWDAEFFSYLEDNLNRIKSRDKECLLHIIDRCCGIKAEIVARDEKESGLRALLNLGHTFGHAFEALTNYQGFTHGQAVAIGTVYAARLACKMGILSSREMERIINLMSNFGLPSSFGKLQPAAVVQKMYSDKKSRGNVLQLVLPVAVGRSKLVPGVSGQLVESVLQEI